ncbi:hypothetical protein ACQCT6_17775 [Cytobacillus gottheilii]
MPEHTDVSSEFDEWARYVNTGIEIIAVEWSKRGRKLNVENYYSIK